MPLKHIVRQGECFASLAARHGFRDYRTLYDHPENAELKRVRPDPNVLAPGDEVFVPDKVQKDLPGATGKRHTFVVRQQRTWLRVEVKIVGDHHYELTVGREIFRGTTDGTAPIAHLILPNANAAELHVWPVDAGPEPPQAGGHFWQLRIGSLDPVEDLTGVQGRLANLGHYVGPIDGKLGDETEHAIASFQRAHALPPTGEPDEVFRATLRKAHGA